MLIIANTVFVMIENVRNVSLGILVSMMEKDINYIVYQNGIG